MFYYVVSIHKIIPKQNYFNKHVYGHIILKCVCFFRYFCNTFIRYV